MSEQKTYCPKTSAKKISDTLLKLSFQADAMIEFIQANRNAKGYVNLGISPRKQVGQYGDTHTVWLDTWQPGQRRPEPKQQDAFAESMQTAPKLMMDSPGGNDVPF